MGPGSGPPWSADPWVVVRPRLERRLDEATSRRLTCIVAGAGYGKSTAVGTWAARRRTVWLSLRPPDQRANVLATALLRAFATAGLDLAPLLTSELVRAAESETVGEGHERGWALAELLCGALEVGAPDDLILVLDDLHELNPSSAGAALVAGMVRQAPAGLHIVALTRRSVPFLTEQLRSRGEVADLVASDLAFDLDEVRAVAEASLRVDAGEYAALVYEVTGGWPAAVRLAIESLRRLRPQEWSGALERLGAPTGPLFSHLAEELLGHEESPVAELIATIAPLETFDAALCATLGIEDAEARLEDLRGRGLFMSATGQGGQLRLHALLRDYLAARLPLTPARLRQVRAAAAAWHVATGDPETALRAAAEAGDSGLVAELLREHGPALLERGRMDALIEAAGRLRPDERDPGLELLVGDALVSRSLFDEAEACYVRAGGDASCLPSALAWRLARVHAGRGDIGEARAALQRVQAASDGGADDARVLAWRAQPSLAAASDTRTLADEAVAAATACGAPDVRAMAHLAACFAHVATDLAAAGRHYEAALAAAKESGDPIQLIRILGAADDVRSPEEQFRLVSTAVAIAQATGDLVWEARATINRGLVAIDLGRYDAAEADLVQARNMLAQIGSSISLAVLFLAEIARIRGDNAQAEAGFREALRLAAAAHNTDVGTTAQMGLARMLARTEPPEARRLADLALAEAPPHHAIYQLVALGWVALVQGQAEEAALLAQRAIAGAAPVPGLRAVLASALELRAMSTPNDAATASDGDGRQALLEEAAALWQSIGNRPAEVVTRYALAVTRGGAHGRASARRAREELRRAGIRDSASMSAGLLGVLPVEDAPALAIRTLGGFAVLLTGCPVELRAWKSKKARDLLKILIVARGRPVSRDRLLDLLWTEDDAPSRSSRLSVALSLLRAVLDPSKQHASDHFVRADREMVQLITGHLVIDLEDFFENARAGLDPARAERSSDTQVRLEAAEALYAGELFEEDPYLDGTGVARDEARALYLQVVGALARLAAAEDDVDAAARYLIRGLAHDPYDERFHLMLVRILVRAGRHGEARRAYRQYTRRMNEIDVEPATYPSDARGQPGTHPALTS